MARKPFRSLFAPGADRPFRIELPETTERGSRAGSPQLRLSSPQARISGPAMRRRCDRFFLTSRFVRYLTTLADADEGGHKAIEVLQPCAVGVLKILFDMTCPANHVNTQYG